MKTRIHSVSRQHMSDITLCRKFLYELKREQPEFIHESVNTDWQYKFGGKAWNEWDKVNCPKCIANNTPGSSLYKGKSVVPVPQELPIDKRYATAIAEAMRLTDRERRKGHEDYSLSSAVTALMEVMNIRLGTTKCSRCRGSGRVAHTTHGFYCWRDGGYGGEDYTVCGPDEECSSCHGVGVISEDLFKKG